MAISRFGKGLRAMGLVLQYSVLYWFLRPRKSMDFLSHVYETYGSHSGRVTTRIREAPLHRLFPGIDRVSVTLQDSEPRSGNVSYRELIYLAALVKRFRPQRIFEFGTFNGRTTLQLIANADPSARVYTLDLPDSELPRARVRLGDETNDEPISWVAGERFHGTALESRIVQLYGDSATYDFRDLERTFDMIFVDGEHSYAYVKNDTEVSFRLLRPGGIVVWHDYLTWSGVTRFLDELSFRRRLYRPSETSLILYIDGAKAVSDLSATDHP